VAVAGTDIHSAAADTPLAAAAAAAAATAAVAARLVGVGGTVASVARLPVAVVEGSGPAVVKHGAAARTLLRLLLQAHIPVTMKH
jgi:hypothetical protein